LAAGKTAGEYTMKKHTLCMTAMLALLLTFGLLLAGCSSPSGGGGGDPRALAFSVSGSFDKNGAAPDGMENGFRLFFR
jgi:hypothetical protein